ncbi:hypothetical protein IEQ34_014073 [Dendrobium chrysotoxum]|uniref:Malic enzyme n=2 Tax=Magnoliopsida TaxID=3398 RepID=A0AAV7GHY1_DENCH|nr:hypothetical protein IEQ34_014073 [Dendrobium chrysotoxum]
MPMKMKIDLEEDVSFYEQTIFSQGAEEAENRYDEFKELEEEEDEELKIKSIQLKDIVRNRPLDHRDSRTVHLYLITEIPEPFICTEAHNGYSVRHSEFTGGMAFFSYLLARRMCWQAASRGWRAFATSEGSRPIIVHKRSLDILHDPWFNKGTAFPITERDRLDLRGLLPPNVMTPQQQIDRFMIDMKRFQVNARDGPSDPNSLAKWRVLIDNIEEYAPIVYTPTVGLVCQNYSGLFRRPRGMYFSAADRGEMMSMVYNWPAEQVDMIVVTDGSRILGLGDLGVHGIGIAIGKLDLYVAAAGINPQRVLPIMIDVGTNNEKLLKDPLYLGLQQHRLDGEDYLAVIDEFMEAVFTRWPRVIVQFEDFQSKWALKLLQRYRNTYRMFNVDVQGTAGVAIAGLLGAVRAQGRSMIDFPRQKIVVAGAGSAGIGVVNAARKTMARMLGNNDSAFESAGRQFWVVDAEGLITDERPNIDANTLSFARKAREMDRLGLREGSSLIEVVKKVKPDVLLGLSAVGGLFSKEVLEALKDSTSTRPAIFPMSNPTKNAECTPEEAFSILGEQIIFASGSPFKDVDLGNGKIGHCNQGNNMYLFPGLAAYMKEEDVLNGIIYPPISSIREITQEVATAVIREAVAGYLAEGYRDMDTRELERLSKGEIHEYVKNNMWNPDYPTLVAPCSCCEEFTWHTTAFALPSVNNVCLNKQDFAVNNYNVDVRELKGTHLLRLKCQGTQL